MVRWIDGQPDKKDLFCMTSTTKGNQVDLDLALEKLVITFVNVFITKRNT